jgi:RHS repeat-associated protein
MVLGYSYISRQHPIQGRDRGQVLAEYEYTLEALGVLGANESAASTTPQLARKFVYGDYIDEPLMLITVTWTEKLIDPKDEKLGTELTATETKYYYHHNANYNVAAMTDHQTAAVVECYRYSAYGQITTITTNNIGNPYNFTSRRYDPETGLYYNYGCYYDPIQGRRLNRDRLEYADSLNTYQWLISSPLQTLDPAGTRIVIVTGLGEDKSKGNPLAEDIKAELSQAIKNAKLDNGEPQIQVELEGGGAWGPQSNLKEHYNSFVEDKDKDACSLEQFAAIGHSDGAAAVFNLLKAGAFNGNAKTGLWTPAVLVTVDLVRVNYLMAVGNMDSNKTETIEKPASCAVANFRQTTGQPLGWKGRILAGASINVDVNKDATISGLNIANPMQGKNLSHFGIFYDAEARKVYAKTVAKAYVWKAKKEKQAKLLERGRFNIPAGDNLSKKGASW